LGGVGGGGESGGHIVAEGPPEKIVNNPEAITGKYLRQLLTETSAISTG